MTANVMKRFHRQHLQNHLIVSLHNLRIKKTHLFSLHVSYLKTLDYSPGDNNENFIQKYSKITKNVSYFSNAKNINSLLR